MLLSKYEYFLAIAEFKNITKASEKLYLSSQA
jgi:DNA-binding transcriptional LysR family regulator